MAHLELSKAPLPKGTELQGGTYRIVQFLDRGGFGCTYEAEHVLFHKRVAIKEFFYRKCCGRNERTQRITVESSSQKPEVDKMKQKFIDEAVIISQMNHPHIVNVSNVFEENGTAYYVMDFIDGQSLGKLLQQQGRLEESTALYYIVQVADALRYVHAMNRLHLDLKPGNIMVDAQDNAVLIDFGASKHYNEETGEQTSTNLGIFSPGFAPAEQMSTKFKNFSPSIDIYALGATLYKCLTGQTPPPAVDLLTGIEKLQPLPATISETTRRAVTQSMQGRSEDRPQTIAAFLALLGAKPMMSASTDQLVKEWIEKGNAYFEQNHYTEAKKWYKKAAALGDAEAQYKLGNIYVEYDEDCAEAVKWYRKAAEQGHMDAQAGLGGIYEHGNILGVGINVDYAEAAKWYKKAAEQGDKEAQLGLGLMYYEGAGVIQKDYAEAVKWFRKLAEQGNKFAQSTLGEIYEAGGYGIQKDLKEAKRWYKSASVIPLC